MIEPKYKVGDRVRIIAIGDLYTGLAGTVRDWKRHNKPRRYHYTLDIDGHTGKYGAGPYGENELEKESRVNITQITVSYGETQSLPEYSNVKPNITLTAVLQNGDDPAEAEALLWQHARTAVQDQIDSALESCGRAAKYDPAPRYQLMKTYRDRWADRGKPKAPKIVVILPNELELARDAYPASLTHAGYPESRGLRLAHVQRLAESVLRENEGYTLIDCSSGDLTPLDAVLNDPAAYEPPDEPAPAPRADDLLVHARDDAGDHITEDDDDDFDEEDEDDDENHRHAGRDADDSAEHARPDRPERHRP